MYCVTSRGISICPAGRWCHQIHESCVLLCPHWATRSLCDRSASAHVVFHDNRGSRSPGQGPPWPSPRVGFCGFLDKVGCSLPGKGVSTEAFSARTRPSHWTCCLWQMPAVPGSPGRPHFFLGTRDSHRSFSDQALHPPISPQATTPVQLPLPTAAGEETSYKAHSALSPALFSLFWGCWDGPRPRTCSTPAAPSLLSVPSRQPGPEVPACGPEPPLEGTDTAPQKTGGPGHDSGFPLRWLRYLASS